MEDLQVGFEMLMFWRGRWEAGRGQCARAGTHSGLGNKHWQRKRDLELLRVYLQAIT
jgi:hypothetical protein